MENWQLRYAVVWTQCGHFKSESPPFTKRDKKSLFSSDNVLLTLSGNEVTNEEKETSTCAMTHVFFSVLLEMYCSRTEYCRVVSQGSDTASMALH